MRDDRARRLRLANLAKLLIDVASVDRQATGVKRHRIAQGAERLRVGGAWQDSELVFADAIGRPIEASSLIRQTLHPLLRAAGLPRIRFHDLRHSAATILLESGAHPRVVAERLGHATPSLVMNVYGHVTERMQGEATATLERALGA
jgi:integrase